MSGPHRTAARDAARLAASDAVELRRQGLSYQDIGERLGVDKKTAWTYVQRAMAERARATAKDRDALIGEQVAIIDTIIEGLLPKAAAGDARSAEVLLKALDRHARLFGLDAPVRVNATVTDEMTAQILALADELAGQPTP